jgi:hypothetical protein
MFSLAGFAQRERDPHKEILVFFHDGVHGNIRLI